METILTIEIFETLINLRLPIQGTLKEFNTIENGIISSGEGTSTSPEATYRLWEIVNDKYTEIYLTDNPEIRWKLLNTLL